MTPWGTYTPLPGCRVFGKVFSLASRFDGHNYPSNTPVMALLFQDRGRQSYNQSFYMGLYKDRNTWCFGNWIQTDTPPGFQTAVPTQFFLNLLPETPVTVVEDHMYSRDHESDYPSLKEVVTRIQSSASELATQAKGL